MALDHKSKTTNPQGMMIVWNYKDRITADGATESPHEIEQIPILTASLKSMSTNKNKASPAGAFEVRLAPRLNWVGRITPGSWCVLLMSQDEFIDQTTSTFPGFCNPKTLKMLGRINSVRLVADVNRETGARMTEYVITGEDWASVFNTKLYIDPIARNNNLDKDSYVGHAARILFDNMLLEWLDNKKAAFPTSSQVVRALIKLWGSPIKDISAAFSNAARALGEEEEGIETKLLITSQSQFELPIDVVRFMKLGSFPGVSAVNLADIIQMYDGKLKSLDKYSGDNEEAQGFPDPFSLYGFHTFWQILTDNCNPVLNELLADIRWEGDTPKLALYKRIRPFATRESFDGSDSSVVKPNISLFKHVRRIDIDLEDVLSINAGTNFRDKINFIEIKPQPQLNKTNHGVQVKLDAQSVDLKAYARDGFKPMIYKVMYMPYDGSEPAPLKATEWKYLLREWYFNTHNMLNGAMTIIGQNQYIQVGDNVRVDARVLGLGPFNKGQEKKLVTSDKAYFLAHVEGISHRFTVDQVTGARSFITTIQFVRGIIVDSSGDPLSAKSGDVNFGFISGSAGGALDQDASTLSTTSEKHANVLGTSTENDPDMDKLEGS